MSDLLPVTTTLRCRCGSEDYHAGDPGELPCITAGVLSLGRRSPPRTARQPENQRLPRSPNRWSPKSSSS